MIAQVIRYGFVGLLSVALYVASTWYLASYKNVNPSTAVFLGFVLATTLNYLLNYYWSFGEDASHQKAAMRFALLVVLGLVWNEVGVHIMMAEGIPLMKAVGVCAITWPLLSFFCLRLWVFRSSTLFRCAY